MCDATGVGEITPPPAKEGRMRVYELIELLSEMEGHEEVRLATQPHYPLQAKLEGVKFVETNAEEISEIEEHIARGELEPEDIEEAQAQIARLKASNDKIVYLLEGSSRGYGSKIWWDQ
jgi:hypothetical protein